ncbi:receptor-like protein 12 [Prunus avium]|uniref:Receptor-like protein 12 n=1 Tax=Prunus avium TaxID=42229 RepID=A0A6P5SUC3_PRUAV|nr:receptor-like protein 12 [Prunus avium]
MRIPLFSWLFLILIHYVSLSVHVFVVSSQCPSEDQQSLLLQLKNSLKFDSAKSNKLVQWKNGSDYCSWEGVSCKDGCVSHLDLSSESISGGLDNSSALFDLQYIENLNLAYNNFNNTQIPPKFDKLTNLSYLNLSNAGFVGQIPIEISQLTRCSGLHGAFPKKIFQLPTLRTIDLWGNQQLQGFLPEFPKNGSLRSLVLSGANFTRFFPNSMGDLKMLSRIDVSSCNFTGSIPRSMENLTQLVSVDLSWNKFNGSIPFFSMAKNLTLINLSSNLLTGQINSSHWENLTNLVNLDLRFNLLDGTIPPSLFSLPMLQKLQLSNNQFSGQLLEFATISVLDTLDLSSNNLEGPIPMSIFNLRGLLILSLSSNNFSGSFPLNGLPQLKNLSSLDLSYSSLSIDYNDTNSPATSFPQITTLNLASVKLRRFPDFLRNQSYLSILDLSQNQIHGEIPNWIWRLNNLSELNLSCNSLETLEGPLLNVTSSLSVLDLHSNQLKGPIPLFSQFSVYLDYSRNNFNSSIPTDIGDFLSYTIFFSLSSNKFPGSIPVSICNATNLQVLDVSNNSLSGLIPQCLTAMSGTLAVLNLQRNKLSGIIPDKFPRNCNLKTLKLNENQIEGQFPNSLANCTMLEVLNVGNNRITDTFPCMLKSISTLRILVLRSNKFYEHIGCPNTNETWPMLQIVDIAHNNFIGEIPGRYLRTWQAMMAHKDDAMSNHFRYEVLKFTEVYFQDAITVTNKGLEMELVKILTVFTSIDMSCNKFNGSIPGELGELKSLYGLNLSNNALTGTIPSSLGNLRQLESLDLSKNSLRGPIPQEVGGLTFLSFLDLSNNQLVGQIPVSTQISTFPAASFAGNKGLWGPPLTVDNKAGLSPPAALNGSLPNSGHHGINWDLISVEIGFTLGFGFSILSLVLCKRWSKWYYRAMYNILLKIFPQLEERIGIHRRHVHINQRWRR